MPSSSLSQIADQVRKDTIRHHQAKAHHAKKTAAAFQAKAMTTRSPTKAAFYTNLQYSQLHKADYHDNVALSYSNEYKKEFGKYAGASVMQNHREFAYGGPRQGAQRGLAHHRAN